ncbi:hypothetical protein AM493_14070 [Flavobacterium akiainvivens]|uniref:DUF416 domain-containing protein n=1 Tax=Flavobacterium akiainvivens TaxID=1202724 RepID=A0A0M8MAH8_9FLAO|nr:DUF416 family protein [Flavobacterium akiainvivens]KOS07033.1 hypothetical protein AM493_14070 [Flavobacterium akiainvivens]SFQ58943.1 Uncharacterized protein YjaG, DUF416 family [Flavobacterium akiainvivens]
MGKDILRTQLSFLSYQEQLVFALLTCDRLLPNYVAFSEKFKFGAPAGLEKIINKLYESTFEDFDNQKINTYINFIETITPDTEDFNSVLVSFALDACTSVLSTLGFILDKNVQNIIDIASYATDTIAMYIQERDNLDANNANLSFVIEEDLFMQEEKHRQLTVIEYLKNNPSVTLPDLNYLRSLGSKNIIDLSLLS